MANLDWGNGYAREQIFNNVGANRRSDWYAIKSRVSMEVHIRITGAASVLILSSHTGTNNNAERITANPITAADMNDNGGMIHWHLGAVDHVQFRIIDLTAGSRVSVDAIFQRLF